jgi:molybdopterin-synthase adenylyltransferase
MELPMDDRFSRHQYLPDWDQGRLDKATVVIMGVGALGNEVAQYLALAGVGKLILCDPDRVERSNLSRAPLFRERDIGRCKADAAAQALADLAPHVSVEARPHRLEVGVGLAELRDASLTLGCLDSRAVRLELAGRCGLVRAPWIDGGTGPWSGEIRLYLNPEGPCYGCGQDEDARAISDDPRSCGAPSNGLPAGAAAPISATIGAHMALLAVRFLMGLSVSDGLLVFDGIKGDLTPRTPAARSNMPVP